MNGKELFIALGDISTKYYEEAESTLPLTHPKLLKKPLLIAAILALTLLLVGCTVLIWNIRQTKIAEIHRDLSGHVDINGNIIKSKKYNYNIFTLHGLEGTPAYLAHQEWFAFLKTYDQDRTLMNAADNKPMDIPEAYEGYSPYTQEMIDKIDEITAKYDLKLLGAFAPFQSWESHIFREATGVQTLLTDDSTADFKMGSGYFYESGNFNLSFHMTMPQQDGNWPYEIIGEIYYSKADCFDEIFWTLGDLVQWEQWTYTTQNGDELLVLWYKNRGGARLFCNRDDALICVSLRAEHHSDYIVETGEYDTITYMTKKQLKQVADQLDFSLRVDTVNMDLAKEELQKFKNQQKAQAEKDPEGYTAYLQPDFASFIQTHLEGKGSERYIAEQYALLDIDGDGTEELLLGNNNQIYEIVYMVNGKAEMIHDGADGSNSNYFPEAYQVCENGYLTSFLDGGDFAYFTAYITEEFEGKKIEKAVETLQYVPSGDCPWSRKSPETSYFDPITEEEYNAIIASYQTINVEMKPISQFE